MHYTEVGQNRDLEALKKEFLDCNSCPTERHCCHFDDYFMLPMNLLDAYRAFGNETVEKLVDDGKASINKEQFDLRTTCPLLTEEGCRRYEEREFLGLGGCVNYPLLIYSRGREFQVVIDYRCSSLENNWDEFNARLEDIVIDGKLDMTDPAREKDQEWLRDILGKDDTDYVPETRLADVMVIYIKGRRMLSLPLDHFNVLRERGRIPKQGMSKSQDSNILDRIVSALS